MTSARDQYIGSLFHAAKQNEDIVLISVDMGAPSLDQWRLELPNQFIPAGISEQNAINVAAGLADSGRIPVVYFMAVWTARCFEQIRYSCAMPGLPVTVVGNGVGLGYAPAGPAHEATEDLAYMRTLPGVEIWSPSSPAQVVGLAEMTHQTPALRYVRLERSMPPDWESRIMPGADHSTHQDGSPLPMRYLGSSSSDPEVAVISSGYMLGRALELADRLTQYGVSTKVADLARLKPLPVDEVVRFCSGARFVVTLEEQFPSGGFGSAVLEALIDGRLHVPVFRVGLPDRFIFANGTREHLLESNGLSIENIERSVLRALGESDDSAS